ncbi:MAG: head decoration protein [Rhodobacteraceae bacterium]|nr:head decoration protein [Paracoccaceae bacterium]MAY44649.1 head decoration protein [Paracoccaceae bacterium]
MPTKTEGTHIGDVLLYEADNFYSRETATIAAGADLTAGAVLGKITASGKFALSAPGASDGSEDPVAVLLADAAAASADVEKALIVVRHATVRRQALNYHASIDTAGERTTALAALAALGIVTDE